MNMKASTTSEPTACVQIATTGKGDAQQRRVRRMICTEVDIGARCGNAIVAIIVELRE